MAALRARNYVPRKPYKPVAPIGEKLSWASMLGSQQQPRCVPAAMQDVSTCMACGYVVCSCSIARKRDHFGKAFDDARASAIELSDRMSRMYPNHWFHDIGVERLVGFLTQKIMKSKTSTDFTGSLMAWAPGELEALLPMGHPRRMPVPTRCSRCGVLAAGANLLQVGICEDAYACDSRLSALIDYKAAELTCATLGRRKEAR